MVEEVIAAVFDVVINKDGSGGTNGWIDYYWKLRKEKDEL